MTPDWLDFLQHAGATKDLVDFGDLDAELLAARDAAVVCPLPELGLLHVDGADALSFLHNLATNDITGLASDELRFAGLCTPKGRLFASFQVWRTAAGASLLLSRDLLDDTLARIRKYILRSKVSLHDASADAVLLGLAGDAALLERLNLAALSPRTFGVFDEGQVTCLRLDERRSVLVMAPAAAPAWWQKLMAAAKPAGMNAWRWLEIRAGQPRVVAATQESFVPQMLNFDTPAVAGVSFTKGCYPGQEIVARAHYLGKVKRRMVRATLPQDGNAAPGTDVFAPETGEQASGQIVLTAPAPGGGRECLVVAQEAAIAARTLHLQSPAGPRLDVIEG